MFNLEEVENINKHIIKPLICCHQNLENFLKDQDLNIEEIL